jgi:hypothetical protein
MLNLNEKIMYQEMLRKQREARLEKGAKQWEPLVGSPGPGVRHTAGFFRRAMEKIMAESGDAYQRDTARLAA